MKLLIASLLLFNWFIFCDSICGPLYPGDIFLTACAGTGTSCGTECSNEWDARFPNWSCYSLRQDTYNCDTFIKLWTENTQMCFCNCYCKFFITLSSNTNKCLDVSGSGNVYLHDCHYRENQQFAQGDEDDDGYSIIRSETKCLDSSRGDNGAVDWHDNIYMHNCHGRDNQKWKIDLNTGLIRNKANGQKWCLDVGDNGNNAHIWSCSTSVGNQKFKFLKKSDVQTAKSIGTNIFKIDNDYDNNQKFTIFMSEYMFDAMVILILVNICCIMIWIYKKRNRFNRGYTVAKYSTATDNENEDEDDVNIQLK